MFEVGKTYPTRGGGTATVTTVADTGFVAENSNGAGGFYTLKGHYGTDEYEHPYDILPGAIEDTSPAPVETLRDRFAMAVAPAVVAATSAGQHRPQMREGEKGISAAIARDVWALTDALLAEREKPHGR